MRIVDNCYDNGRNKHLLLFTLHVAVPLSLITIIAHGFRHISFSVISRRLLGRFRKQTAFAAACSKLANRDLLVPKSHLRLCFIMKHHHGASSSSPNFLV